MCRAMDQLQKYQLPLTKRQRQILTRMRGSRDNAGGELVYEAGVGYLGLERISSRTVFALLRLCAIRSTGGDCGRFERYVINETGLALLAEASR